MARQKAPKQHEDLNLERTRASSVWVALTIGVLFLILLIDFIAQNNRRVPIHFFTASGHASLALALLVAAVAGAAIVLLAGAARILQLRLAARRQSRQEVRRQNADAVTTPTSTAAATKSSSESVEP